MFQVLVVDGDKERQADIVNLLSINNIGKATIAGTVTEVDEYLAKKSFDMAIVNVNQVVIPDKDGVEIIKKLDQKNCRYIIGITSGAELPTIVEAHLAGARDFIDFSWNAVSGTALLEKKMIIWKNVSTSKVSCSASQ